MTEREILTEKHAYWKGFSTRLRDSMPNYTNDETLLKYCCSLDITRKILTSLPNINVEGSIKYLESQGGDSDWEIFNIARIA